jgi:hypothetical protein
MPFAAPLKRRVRFLEMGRDLFVAIHDEDRVFILKIPTLIA